ncbi:flagellar protein MotY [Saliniradius amylolyticus]|nr:OmpA family protein [Saliniradius amylolyticus]
MKRTVLALTVLIALPVTAGVRHYSADINESQWQLTDSSRLQCRLEHNIPGYGDAMFTSRASKQLNLEFELDMLSLPSEYGAAAVYSAPPEWMPGQMQRRLAEMPIRKQYNGDLPQKTAWTMLSELEKGYWPTIYYQDWYNRYDRVAVELNASNFIGEYQSFVRCVSSLLKFSFEDISYSVLQYKKNSDEFTRASEKKLSMIAQYLREDPGIELVLVDAYTDSWGGSWHNRELSKQRAQRVKRFFEENGIDSDRIETTAHGERRHIADNAREVTRAKNRRVVIRMAKS